ncbi:unnamed protein product [Thlaspi arvense]|uniref:Peptidase A1 domain-containing protein n=1 Tax=Thlaspi arvense TaxID=13288 RepID=A0AAU9SVP2_THLAR|nr:unnamed protein product [Thlaspi arvense]
MGGFTRLIVFLSIFASITLKSEAQYLLPITKHEPTKQFYTALNIGSAAKTPVNLLLDLGTNLTWLNCRKLKSLSSLRLVTCQSSTCKSLPGNGCDGKSCLYRQPNPLGKNPAVTTGRVVQDRATISTTDGGKFLSEVSLRRFTFSCAGEKSLQGFPPPVAGVLGLSPGQFPFWRQVTTAFNIIPKFALCLPSSGTGHFYIGGGQYYHIPPFNGGGNSIPMTLTPLKNIGSGNYLISVTSVYVDGTPLSLNPNLLEGGAKLSTVVPYTVLQTDIYNALALSFTRKATKVGMFEASGPAPFKNCFEEGASGRNMSGMTNVPVIEIGVPGRAGEVKWRFHGANTVVRVMETVVCLAFVDGGKNLKESMVIGTHQLQDFMIDFDFSTTLLAFNDATNLYYCPISIGATYYQRQHFNAAIDLGGSAPLLLTCAAAAKSRSYHPIKCGSSRCKQAKPDSLSCPSNTTKKSTCQKSFSTSYTDHPIKARLLRETVALLYTYNGFTVMDSELELPLTIACTDVKVDPSIKPLPSIVNGTLGLANTLMSLPSQVVSLHKLPLKVALCLPSRYGSPFDSGALYIGGGPYYMAPYPKDVSKIFASTPLLASDPSRGEYFIDVKSIQIGGKIIPFFKKSTKICTLAPYTVLHTSIYKALVLAFAGKAKMAKAPAVKPFGSCFSSKGLGMTMMGSSVPVIELVLSGGAKWKIYGSNSLVQVSKDVVCLGFLDGGVDLKMVAMVIGGFQMEDNLVEFDLKASKLSFSSSLLLRNSSCSQSRLF